MKKLISIVCFLFSFNAMAGLMYISCKAKDPCQYQDSLGYCIGTYTTGDFVIDDPGRGGPTVTLVKLYSASNKKTVQFPVGVGAYSFSGTDWDGDNHIQAESVGGTLAEYYGSIVLDKKAKFSITCNRLM